MEDMKPVRVQRRRTPGWRMPENTVYVGRGTPWGNPFVVGKPGGAYSAMVTDRRHAYLLFKSIATDNEKLIAAAQEQLRGKNLACWCPRDDPYEDCCHGAVLLEIANRPHPPLPDAGGR